MNHGDSCAQGSFAPKWGFSRTVPPVRRFEPPAYRFWREFRELAGRFEPDLGLGVP